MEVYGAAPTPTPTPTPTPGAGISGIVTALPGSDIAGTTVGACPVVDSEPDCTNPSATIEITQSGSSAPYSLDVSAGLYAIAAYQTTDGNTFTVVGIYESSQNLVLVSPPASDINFQIEATASSASLNLSGMDKLNMGKFNLNDLRNLLQ